MSVIVLNAGEQALLANGLTGVAYNLRLFKTDVTAGLTPEQVDALTAANFTEATFTGYAAAAVGTVDWTITQGNPTTAVNVEKQFTSSANQAAQTIWGYYVTRTSDGVAIWFEDFDGPVSIEFLNDRIDVTPRVTLDDTEGNGLAVGDIILSARATPAVGRFKCDGSAKSRTTFADLFAAIGTAYGIGDGATTFNVPDYRQRFPLGKADAGTGSTLGITGGAIDHVHGLDTSTSHAKIATFTASPYIGQTQKTVSSYNRTRQITTALTNTADTGAQTSATALGGDSATANPPFQVCNYEIVYQR